MPLRVLFLLLSFVIFTNLVLMLLSAILNKNLYKTHGKLIANCYGIFILILVILYVSLSIAGIK
jgi:hypothetical protein